VFDRFVVNASPLIFLSSVDGLEWVARLSAHAVRIPHSVVVEVEAGPGGKEIIDTIPGETGASRSRQTLWCRPWSRRGTLDGANPRCSLSACGNPA
jgi:hypothetical protein